MIQSLSIASEELLLFLTENTEAPVLLVREPVDVHPGHAIVETLDLHREEEIVEAPPPAQVFDVLSDFPSKHILVPWWELEFIFILVSPGILR